MALIKLGQENSIQEGERIVKECYDRCVVAIKYTEGRFHCFELPDSGFAEADVDRIRTVPGSRPLPTYRDSDGTLWVNLPTLVKPVVDKTLKLPTEFDGVVASAGGPPPLVPFAGCDRKAMPPSPAKPFSLPASPYKPSPFKERVDSATKAVVEKNFPQEGKWSQRQAKMGEFFSAKKKVAEQPLSAVQDA